MNINHSKYPNKKNIFFVIFFPNEIYEELVFKDNVWNGKKTIVLPHPSPLNKKWIKDHPQFLQKRIHEIRNTIWDILKE